MQTGFLIFVGLLAFSSAATTIAGVEESTIGSTIAGEPTIATTIAGVEESTIGSTITDAPSTGTTIADVEESSIGSTITDATTIGTTIADVEKSTSVTDAPPGECLYDSQTWGTEDLRKFYFCSNGMPFEMECDEDSYFVSNTTLSGCIPANQMNPKCVNEEIKVGPCTGINMKQPQASQILTNFWLCTEENAPPVELTCTKDMAFAKQNGYLGCYEWKMWRQLRGCY